MLISYSLCFAVLIANVHAVFNLTLAVSQLPLCAVKCSGTILAAGNCNLVDGPDCLCTNITMQSNLFTCVEATCNYTDQLVSAHVSQTLICDGIPQPTRKTEIIRTVAIITAVTVPFVILRVLSRYLIGGFWWDDWLVLIAAVLLIPMSAIPIFNATKGFGEHLWNLPPQNITLMLELYYASQILYCIVQVLAKIAILLFYLRVFPDDRFRLITKIATVGVGLTSTAFGFAIIFQCTPIRAAWMPNLQAKCISPKGLVYGGAVFSILEDLIIILLPVRQLQALKLSWRKRLALILMFAVGSFACITSMYRLRWIVSYELHTLDSTWTNVDVVVWSVIEVYVAIICASLMTIKPLLNRWMPNLFNSTRTSENNELSNSNSWKFRAGFKKSPNPWSISAATNVTTGSEENILENGNSNETQEGESESKDRGTKVWVKSTYTVHTEEGAEVS